MKPDISNLEVVTIERLLQQPNIKRQLKALARLKDNDHVCKI